MNREGIEDQYCERLSQHRVSDYFIRGDYVIEYLPEVRVRRGKTSEAIRIFEYDDFTGGFREVAAESCPNQKDRVFTPLRENHPDSQVVTIIRRFEREGYHYFRTFYEDKFGRQDIDQEKLQELLTAFDTLGNLSSSNNSGPDGPSID